MKPTKLTSWMMMLIFVLGGTTAKAQYFDDVYYTSKKKIANKEVANKQVKHSYYNENEYSEEPTLLSSYNRSSSYNDYDRSVDEYNRRYSSNDEWYDDDYRYQDNKKTKVTVVPKDVPTWNIASASSATIHPARSRLSAQTKSICT